MNIIKKFSNMCKNDVETSQKTGVLGPKIARNNKNGEKTIRKIKFVQ